MSLNHCQSFAQLNRSAKNLNRNHSSKDLWLLFSWRYKKIFEKYYRASSFVGWKHSVKGREEEKHSPKIIFSHFPFNFFSPTNIFWNEKSVRFPWTTHESGGEKKGITFQIHKNHTQQSFTISTNFHPNASEWMKRENLIGEKKKKEK